MNRWRPGRGRSSSRPPSLRHRPRPPLANGRSRPRWENLAADCELDGARQAGIQRRKVDPGDTAGVRVGAAGIQQAPHQPRHESRHRNQWERSPVPPTSRDRHPFGFSIRCAIREIRGARARAAREPRRRCRGWHHHQPGTESTARAARVRTNTLFGERPADANGRYSRLRGLGIVAQMSRRCVSSLGSWDAVACSGGGARRKERRARAPAPLLTVAAGPAVPAAPAAVSAWPSKASSTTASMCRSAAPRSGSARRCPVGNGRQLRDRGVVPPTIWTPRWRRRTRPIRRSVALPGLRAPIPRCISTRSSTPHEAMLSVTLSAPLPANEVANCQFANPARSEAMGQASASATQGAPSR